MEVGLYDNDAMTVRTSCAHTNTHGVGLLQRCLSVSVMPLRDGDVNVTRTESVQHLHQPETHTAFVSEEHCLDRTAVMMLLDKNPVLPVRILVFIKRSKILNADQETEHK